MTLLPTVLPPDMLPDVDENEMRMISRGRVEQYVERGLLTKDSIDERFTYIVIESSYTPGLANCELNHDHLSKTRFAQDISQALGAELPDNTETLTILYSIVRWHAAFPFPVQESEPLNTTSLAKATAVLERESLLWGEGEMSISQTRYTSCTTRRNRGDQDRRRLLFRSISDQVPEAVDRREVETLPILESTYYDYDESLPMGSWERRATEVKREITNREDERCVDLVDVITHSGLEREGVAPSLRSSFRSAVKSISHYSNYLHDFLLDRETLRRLIRLMLWLQWRTDTGESKMDLRNLSQVVDRLIIAFQSKGTVGINWTNFDRVVERNFPFLFDCLPGVPLTILTGSDATLPLIKTVPKVFKQENILDIWMYIQIRSFLPLQAEKLLYSTTGESSYEDFVQKVLEHKNSSIMLIQGHSLQKDDQDSEEDITIGAYIPGPWTSSASFPSMGLKSQDAAPFAFNIRTVLFQLSPIHRVYQGRRIWRESANSEPIVQTSGVTFGRPLDEAFGSEAIPSGQTYLALNASMDQAVFEHGEQKSPGGEFQGFLPFGPGEEGEIRIKVHKVEVWAATDNYSYYGTGA